MNSYKSMAFRIREAKTLEELNKCDNSLDNLFNNGFFTISEFKRLDLLIVDNKIRLEL